ncbi:hypothetical protein PtA15_11A568 [Puccinia triticina]|uniref:Uncharacterized protein n=1 Tax=Puccinia triticina TaxID=208348 RepID=A0ABY7D0I9_9BASI|nr:uncharacterized protein PtA15_11A568 [Puccinia triticina]WAQ89876.1 hypothetical protein PtA15_11A568 [Puccinia triticina]
MTPARPLPPLLQRGLYWTDLAILLHFPPTYAVVFVSGNPNRVTISHANTANQSLRKPSAKDLTPAQTSDLSSAQSTHSLMPEKPMATPEIISSGRQKHGQFTLNIQHQPLILGDQSAVSILFSTFAVDQQRIWE